MQGGSCFPPVCQLPVQASCDRKQADIKLQQQKNVLVLTLQCETLGQCQCVRIFSIVLTVIQISFSLKDWTGQ